MGTDKPFKRCKYWQRAILLFMIVLLASTSVYGGDFNRAGRTALQFLKIGIGARSAGSGEACIANMDGSNAVFWNAAAITGVRRADASFDYTTWIGGINFTSGVVGYRFSSSTVFAVDYISMNYGDIDEALVTSPTGNLDTRTGDTFTGSDLSIGFTIAKKFTDKLSIGLRTKYLREDLFTYSTSLLAFDVGTYYETGWKGIRLAMSAQNFAAQARWIHTRIKQQQQYEIPLLFRIGTSIDLIGGQDLVFGGNPDKNRLTVNIDAIHSNDYAERFNIGMEYWLFDRFGLRSGYRMNRAEGQWAVGGSLKTKVSTVQLILDYAYVDYDYLNSVHRFSTYFSF